MKRKPYSYDNLPPIIAWWIDYLGQMAEHMATQKHPFLKWLKCESIERK